MKTIIIVLATLLGLTTIATADECVTPTEFAATVEEFNKGVEFPVELVTEVVVDNTLLQFWYGRPHDTVLAIEYTDGCITHTSELSLNTFEAEHGIHRVSNET